MSRTEQPLIPSKGSQSWHGALRPQGAAARDGLDCFTPHPVALASRFRRALTLILTLTALGSAGWLLVLHGSACEDVCHWEPSAAYGRRSLAEGSADLRNLTQLATPGQPFIFQPTAAAKPARQGVEIPRIIHQINPATVLATEIRHMTTWRQKNPTWEVRFYDSAACLQFVRTHFSRYLAAYEALPQNVERADFCRYMVVLKHGGVSADVDTDSARSMDELMQPGDRLVVGWEREYADDQLMAKDKFVRAAQVQQRGKGQTGIRILPKVAFAPDANGPAMVTRDDPRVFVWHHFSGAWKGHARSARLQCRPSNVPRALCALRAKMLGSKGASSADAGSGSRALSPKGVGEYGGGKARDRLHPVSMTWQPPFYMMVFPIGQGPKQAGMDVSAELTKYGEWQPPLPYNVTPTPVQAMLSALDRGSSAASAKGKWRQASGQRGLLDVGPGMGLLTLTAAARGHRVVAFEPGARNADSLGASIVVNRFEKLIELHKEAIPISEAAMCNTSMRNSRKQHQCLDPAAEHEPAGGKLHMEIGAVHINAPSQEAAIAQELKALLTGPNPPAAVLMDLYPSKLEGRGSSPFGWASVLDKLHDFGYTEVTHAGHACNARWKAHLASMQPEGNHTNARMRQSKLEQMVTWPRDRPAWCPLPTTLFATFLVDIPVGSAEHVLLQQAGSAERGPPSDSDDVHRRVQAAVDQGKASTLADQSCAVLYDSSNAGLRMSLSQQPDSALTWSARNKLRSEVRDQERQSKNANRH
ncbi:hypothetical protein WJX73_008696 [Symbiochloris irregularis]|uniref:Uncharacterized protein n=1 Tax=Symbiochloris irregularis TaxID=706552 RepID=A0AAW1NR87_9CHLO